MGAFQSIEDIPAHGGLSTFNIQDGYCEAVVRGYRKGFITDTEYFQLRGAANLSDVKLNLGDTDYDGFLTQGKDTVGELSPSLFKEMAILKFTNEFKYLRTQANQPLSTFLDYITYEYMIKNIIWILEAMFRNPDSNAEDVKRGCHPMGELSERTMNLIASFKNSKKAINELVENVLVNTPVGKYFELYLMKTQPDQVLKGGQEVVGILDERNYQMIEHHVMRLYLEDFYQFVLRLGGETAEVMGNLLKVRADELSINIVLNSFDWELGTSMDMRKSDRQDLLPSFGKIYPQGTTLLQHVKSVEELGKFLESYQDYKEIWNVWAPTTGDDEDDEAMGSFEDGWYHYKLELYETAFYGQCHYAPFYAFIKLKEQEVRNLNFISECIQQRQKDKIKYLPIFSKNRKLKAWSMRETREKAAK